MKYKKSVGEQTFDVCNYLLMIALVIVTLYPCYYVLVASLSDPTRIYEGSGMLLYPKGFVTGAYQNVFSYTQLWISYARQTLFKSLEQKKTFTTYASINQFMKAWFQTGGTSSGGGNSGGGVSHGGTGSLSGGVVSENVTDNQTNSLALTPTAKFTDLSGVDWALEAIEYLANKKIISGVSETKFEPDRNITKEEFVKLLVEAFGLSAGESAVEFRDVNQSDWFFRYVVIAAQNGVVNGLGDGTFGVGTSLSRQDMATMLARTLAHKKIELKQSSDMPCFSDEHEIADYAAEAVQTLCRAGVMNGIGETKFAPDAPSTRAMAAKVIYLLIKE